MKQTKELVQEVSNYVNSFTNKGEEFCNEMSREHRTLQQSFTKLCLSWLEHCASDEYRTDGRNEQSQKIARELLDSFRDKQIKEGFTGETLKMMSKPSGYLGCI
jgi:Mn-dependent DtxR family transcriptional regulator